MLFGDIKLGIRRQIPTSSQSISISNINKNPKDENQISP